MLCPFGDDKVVLKDGCILSEEEEETAEERPDWEAPLPASSDESTISRHADDIDTSDEPDLDNLSGVEAAKDLTGKV